LAENRKFSTLSNPFSFSTFVWGDPVRIYGKALQFLKLEVFQSADAEDMVILTCTVFDWSTCVTDGRTDRRTNRRTVLRWQRCAKAV